MVGSGRALWRFGRLRSGRSKGWAKNQTGNKKGPERDPEHTARFVGSRQLPPAVRQGTTIIRRLVILLRMASVRLLETCAKHSGENPCVKACCPGLRRDQRLARPRRFGEWEN